MNIKHITTYLIITMLLCSNKMSAQKDTIFYNKDWKETSKPQAHFYRPLPLQQQGDKSLIKDYFMDGTLQFEAWSKSNDLEKHYDGKVVYYYPNGNKQAEVNYENNKRNGPEISYYENGNLKREQQLVNDERVSSKSYTKEGELRSTLLYKNGYPEDGVSDCFIVYKKGRRVGETLYYENTNVPAYVSKCSEEGCYNAETETYFDKKGAIIQENKRTEEKLQEGRAIEFYESKQCGYVKAIKSITTVSNGDFNGPFIRYDIDGAELYRGTYKMHEPKDGIFELEKFNLIFITEYKDGLKNGKEIVYNEDKKIAEGNYIDGEKQNGSFVEERRFTSWSKIPIILNLKHGVEEGQQKFYNVARDITMGYYHAKNGIKDGAYAVFDYDGEVRTKATYKNGKPFEGAVIYNDDFRFYTNGERIRENINEDMIEKERMQAFSKDSDTLHGSYNMGGFETASSIVFLDTHQFFFSLSVGSLDLITYGAYHLKNGKLKLYIPQEQKHDFIVYGRKDTTLKDSIQIKYYNYNANSKPLLQLNRQWYALENLKQQNESRSSNRNAEIFKLDLNNLSTLKIGIKSANDTDFVLKSMLEAESVTDFNDFIIAYNVSSKEITQFESSTFTLSGENMINGDKEIKKRTITEEDKESVLDYIIENRAFPYFIKSNTFQKVKMNSKVSNQKVKKYMQLNKIEE